MGYFKDASNHIKSLAPNLFNDQQEPSWVDTLRFAKDTLHNGALLAAGAAIGVELAGDGPITHAWALGLGCLAIMGEAGSFINDKDLQRELAQKQLVQQLQPE